ncbi:YsnF/AvaK domain-containing protein [Paenibacillus sp. JX-17]|uniref:YsnF/AvaK domain-containing protein n=1 Tax=Paenibacillus lacisoli TaxID=3064525 RepID=A0ABT9CB16_9BACL|nr:YsnF/AvaK domain-containing protein [Paenibacillus sp. JX-17]MDO7906436.1 YsnF/AvaK domain-containing protein [Paenibacillus sp. JX-17]
MNKKLVGVFNTETDASNAIENLKSQGFRTEDISVIAKDRKDVTAISEETGTKAPEGLASGAATGGILGGVAGLLAGIGALAIPGIGPIIAAGPIAATLTGAAVGAGAGGLVGGLIGFGIPEDEAKTYDNNVNEGKILVLVDGDESQRSRIYDAFRSNHAVNTEYYNDDTDTDVRGVAAPVDHTARSGAGLSSMDTTLDREVDRTPNTMDTANTLDTDVDRDAKLKLHEEKLDISKNQVQTGEVELRKEVVEEQKNIQVPVSHEEIVIERRAVNDVDTNEPIGRDETIRIPVSEEQVDVTKHNVVTGEVEAHKRTVQGTQEVQDTVRREEARIDRSGSPAVSGDGAFDKTLDPATGRPRNYSVDAEEADSLNDPGLAEDGVYGSRTDRTYNKR